MNMIAIGQKTVSCRATGECKNTRSVSINGMSNNPKPMAGEAGTAQNLCRRSQVDKPDNQNGIDKPKHHRACIAHKNTGGVIVVKQKSEYAAKQGKRI